MKDNKSKAVKFPELKDHEGYSRALGKLERLDSAIADANRRIELLKFNANRASSETRQYLNRNGLIFAADESTLEHLAVRITEVGQVSPEMLVKVRRATPELPGLDRYDLEFVCEVEDAEAVKQLLNRAIAIQRREVSRQKNLAITEICRSIQSERERIASNLANEALRFAGALEKEISFVDQLRIQDDAIVASLSPGPFPANSRLSDPEVKAWIVQALNLTGEEAENLVLAELPREIAARRAS